MSQTSMSDMIDTEITFKEFLMRWLPVISKRNDSEVRTKVDEDSGGVAFDHKGKTARIYIVNISAGGARIRVVNASYDLGERVEILLNDKWGVGKRMTGTVVDQKLLYYGKSGDLETCHALYSIRFDSENEVTGELEVEV